MPEQQDEDGRDYRRIEHLREMVESVRADLREIRTWRESDQRMQAIYYADASAWRTEMKNRIDGLGEAVNGIKVQLAHDGHPQASPVTAALSAAGGGGGALLIYLVAKAIGVIPQ